MLDQSAIARFAERHLMSDRVQIRRGNGEDMLDPETGDLVPARPLIVYDDKGGLYAHQERIRGTGSGQDGAWVEEVRAGYRLLLPLDAPEVCEDDTVLVMEARDSQAVGRTYRVTAQGEVSSFPVLRTVWLEEHNRRPGAQ
ncbi:DUF6093 family protein [Streptomyces roseochromogenus]|uniref:Uncharacterized protein n=1 Tax=Streptomyces roseochromogenus subsp. oscitans DS 12.976 TaxID=1352936 RepID=V6K5J2_STRRC|nr:DUF6093 family protein [Streptomyces roseochromogenus]EST27402.1 hypothetical protein M878_25735 [Streptomyces roseochromogenus subsp. oscitans DS 12.976]